MANFTQIHKDDYYSYYKVKIHGLTEEEKAWIMRLSDIRRFVYNWFLEYSEKQWQEHHIPFQGYKRLSNKITELRNSEEYGWLKDYNLCVLRGALKDLDMGFKKFRAKCCRHPIYKSKKTDVIRFSTRGDRLAIYGRYAYIPGLCVKKGQRIDLKNHNIPVGENIKYIDSCVVGDGDNFWLCVTVKNTVPFTEVTPYIYPNPVLGVDVGVRTAAVLSDGTMYDGPNKYRLKLLENRRDKLKETIVRDQYRRMRVSRRTRTKYDDIPKSKNQLKRESKLRQTYRDITNLYKTRYHQIASDIAKKKSSVVVLENLQVRKMLQNNKGNPANMRFDEAKLYTLLTYIDQKCTITGNVVLRADKNFKSSQICSRCGAEYKIGRSKVYKCKCCGLVIDRDLNAAINLRNFGVNYFKSNPYEGESILVQ